MKTIFLFLTGLFFCVNIHAQTSGAPKKNIRTDTIAAGQLTFLLDTNVVSYKMTFRNNGILVSVNKTGNIVYTTDEKSGDVILIEEITIKAAGGKLKKAPSRRLVFK